MSGNNIFDNFELARIIGEPKNPKLLYPDLISRIGEDRDSLKYHIREAIKRVNEENNSGDSCKSRE